MTRTLAIQAMTRAQHIGEVVSRVRQQRYGVRQHAEHELHRNERHVEADADGKGPAETCWGVNMTGPMAMFMVMVSFLSLHGSFPNHGCPFHQVLDMEAAPFYSAAARVRPQLELARLRRLSG